MEENILTLKHTEEHAQLSASGSHRWVLCAGSVAAEAGLKGKSSVYAEEGKLAHILAEHMFFKKDYSKLNVPDEMVEYMQTYMDHLDSILPDENLLHPKTLYYLEKRVDYSHIVPTGTTGFGTADAIIINSTIYGEELHIIDLKYGIGKKVDAFENTQLLLYAIGTLNTLKEHTTNVHKIHLDIVQPRLNNISRWSISLAELKVWEGYLKAKAEAAMQPNAPRVASTEACQWCKAFPTCNAPYELIDNVPLDKKELTDEQVRKILDNSKLIIKFVNTIEEKVYNSLLAGQQFKGYKLIEGKHVRKLKEDSEKKLVELLGSQAYDYKLLGVMKLEKLLGKDLLNSLTYYSPCKPILVKEDDKRESIVLEELSYDAA